jgi:WD40 repeat protein
VRTLTGHLSNCVVVDFHPFGEFFASGSMDTNLKIWDIRRKGCIQTYKGHTAGVTHVRFSPDGKWVVSGSEDSRIKLWDLTAGKQVWHPNPKTRDLRWRPAEAPAAPPYICPGATTGVPSRLPLASPCRWRWLPVARAVVTAAGGSAVRQIHEFKQHEGAIRAMDFHPHELLLASGSQDRTVCTPLRGHILAPREWKPALSATGQGPCVEPRAACM